MTDNDCKQQLDSYLRALSPLEESLKTPALLPPSPAPTSALPTVHEQSGDHHHSRHHRRTNGTRGKRDSSDATVCTHQLISRYVHAESGAFGNDPNTGRSDCLHVWEHRQRMSRHVTRRQGSSSIRYESNRWSIHTWRCFRSYKKMSEQNYWKLPVPTISTHRLRRNAYVSVWMTIAVSAISAIISRVWKGSVKAPHPRVIWVSRPHATILIKPPMRLKLTRCLTTDPSVDEVSEMASVLFALYHHLFV